MFQSDPNYPFILFFAGLGVASLLMTVFGWRRDSQGWRLASAFFTFTMFAQSAWELSFAFVPVREWIRIDLLLTLPYAVTGFTVLLGRAAWRYWMRGRGIEGDGERG